MGRVILGKLNRSRKRKEGRKTATIVVIWVGLGKEVSEQEGEFLGLFFFFNEKKNEVRNVGFCYFSVLRPSLIP